MSGYYYLGDEEFVTKDGKSFSKIFILDMKNKLVHTIFKLSTKELIEKLTCLDFFDDVTNSIGFDVKRNGSISLDIK